MNHLINFVKIQAAGNDFVICKEESVLLDHLKPESVQNICDRKYGIGSDGFVIIKEAPKDQFRMYYFNADGTEGEMCGNGLRAAVLFCYMNGFIKSGQWYDFNASDGKHRVIYHSGDEIKVEISVQGQPEFIQDSDLSLPANMDIWGSLNTGVPHLVLNVKDDIEKAEVFSLGRAYRNHERFQKQGTNVNFVKILGENYIHVRTYERGVEQETLSCGTGVTASALLYLEKFGNGAKRVKIRTKGGHLDVIKDEKQIYLVGPAKICFTGHYLLESKNSENIS